MTSKIGTHVQPRLRLEWYVPAIVWKQTHKCEYTCLRPLGPCLELSALYQMSLSCPPRAERKTSGCDNNNNDNNNDTTQIALTLLHTITLMILILIIMICIIATIIIIIIIIMAELSAGRLGCDGNTRRFAMTTTDWQPSTSLPHGALHLACFMLCVCVYVSLCTVCIT